MSAILFSSARVVKSPRFAAGLFVQREKLPTGPSADDREWSASALNAATTAYSTEDGDWQTHEARTVSRREWLALQTEMATERFVAACDAISDRIESRREPEEAEVAEIGSQVGHAAEMTFTPAEVATLGRLGETTDNAPAWEFSEAMLDECAAEVAAKKPARKPRPKTLRQINRARLALAKAAIG